MRTLRLAIALSLVGAWIAGTAVAQTMSSPVQQPSSIQQMGFQADDSAGYAVADQAAASPGNQPPAPPVTSTTAPSTPPVAGPAEAAGQQSVVPPANPEAAAPAPEAPTPHAGEPALRRFWDVQWDAWTKKGYDDPGPDPPRRCNPPAPWGSPPYPGTDWQGYPLIGIPQSPPSGVMQTWINGGQYGDWFKKNNIGIDGWMTASYNASNATFSNSPTSYFLVPNHLELDQLCFRVQKTYDTVQTDHIDWGFRSVALFGMDYRYMVAGGWQPASDQLLLNNDLYGLDFTEQYAEVYFPKIGPGGMVVRIGRWIACPDIEVQYSPDNYLASHSLLFTYDTYTQTGVMFTFKINRQLMIQGAIESGTDMAPWYPGAVATGFAGLRWVSEDNHDAFYTCLNNINAAEFRHLDVAGNAVGHDDYNYIVSTYEHKFNENVHTATEAYFMWQIDAVLGGTPTLGTVGSYGGGGGGLANVPVSQGGILVPGVSRAYGFLNYTEFGMAGTNAGDWAKNDYICVRNEWWEDDRGMRSGVPGNYTSDTIGYCHNFNAALQVRPEFGFYRNWNNPAFDNGKLQNLYMFAVDFTYHW
jgi:hypothetical protein